MFLFVFISACITGEGVFFKKDSEFQPKIGSKLPLVIIGSKISSNILEENQKELVTIENKISKKETDLLKKKAENLRADIEVKIGKINIILLGILIFVYCSFFTIF